MRFYGTLLVVLIVMLLGIILLIFSSVIAFSTQPSSIFLRMMILSAGIFLFTIGFHEFCHLVGILITHNQSMVRGLVFSWRRDIFGIKYAGQVPQEDASLVYLLGLLTVPATFLIVFCGFLVFLLRFLPFSSALSCSILMALITIPFTLMMSYTHDIKAWKRVRHKKE